MIEYSCLFIVILFFATIINILFLFGFYYEFYNRCNHINFIKKIESEMHYNPYMYYWSDFCDYEEDGNTGPKALKVFLIVFIAIYGLSLLIAYITFVVSLCKNAK